MADVTFLDRPLRPGLRGVIDTVRIIIALICMGSRDPAVERVVVDDQLPLDSLGRAVAVFLKVKRHVTYTEDPPDIELVQSARRTLRRKAGDCDDFTVLIGALLVAAGLRVRVRVVRTGVHRQFNHVLPEAMVRGGWFTLDATTPESKPGDVVAGVTKSMEFIVPCQR